MRQLTWPRAPRIWRVRGTRVLPVSGVQGRAPAASTSEGLVCHPRGLGQGGGFRLHVAQRRSQGPRLPCTSSAHAEGDRRLRTASRLEEYFGATTFMAPAVRGRAGLGARSARPAGLAHPTIPRTTAHVTPASAGVLGLSGPPQVSGFGQDAWRQAPTPTALPGPPRSRGGFTPLRQPPPSTSTSRYRVRRSRRGAGGLVVAGAACDRLLRSAPMSDVPPPLRPSPRGRPSRPRRARLASSGGVRPRPRR